MISQIHILGSSGFIGRHIYKGLVKSFSIEINGYSSDKCNLLDYSSIEMALNEIDEKSVIVLASAITRLRDNSFVSLQKNIQMIINLCRFIEQHPVRQVIFFSTIDVYGLTDDDVIISEKLLPMPNDNYAISKVSSEYILRKEAQRGKFALTVFRLSGVYGDGDEGKSTINALISSALSLGKITIFGDGSNLRDFVYIDDVVELTVSAIQKDINATVNLATGRSLSISKISRLIVKEIGCPCSIEFRQAVVTKEKRVKHLGFDVSLLHELFPNTDFTDLQQGIKYYLSSLV